MLKVKMPFKLKDKLKSEAPSLLTPESSPIKVPDQSDVDSTMDQSDVNLTMDDLGNINIFPTKNSALKICLTIETSVARTFYTIVVVRKTRNLA